MSDIEEEEYIISGNELVWPDPESMKRFKPEARKIIDPFLDYIHLDKSMHYARDTKLERESLALEKAARDMNHKYPDLVAFAWVPGYPRTIVPLVPQLINEEAPDLAQGVAEFWEIYQNNEEALQAYREFVKKAETWALMRLDCKTQKFWDSEKENLYIALCIGQPVNSDVEQ